MQVRTRSIATSLVALLVLLSARTSSAQNVTLARVDSLIMAGQSAQARSALDAWKKSNPPDARSTYLTARLASQAQEAEDAYLSVALGYSNSPYAAESLLRLGQARLAAGDAKQAAVYLRRVISDYPTSEHRSTAQEWLARVPPVVAAAPPTTGAQPQVAKPAAPAAAPAARYRHAVQVAAFRDINGARSVARQLEKSGFANVRLVTVPANSLIRVRIGTFENSAAASALAAKVKAAGFTAAVVADALSEQALRN